MPTSSEAVAKFYSLVKDNPHDQDQIVEAFSNKFGFNPIEKDKQFFDVLKANPKDKIDIQSAFKGKYGYVPVGGESIDTEKLKRRGEAYKKIYGPQRAQELREEAAQGVYLDPKPGIASSFSAGVMQGSVGLVAGVEKGVGRMLGNGALEKRGERLGAMLGAYEEKANRGGIADILATQAGTMAVQAPLFGVGAGAVEKAAGATVGKTAIGRAMGEAGKEFMHAAPTAGKIMKGGAAGMAFQAPLSAVNIAGAQNKEELKAALDAVPTEFMTSFLLGAGGEMFHKTKARETLKGKLPIDPGLPDRAYDDHVVLYEVSGALNANKVDAAQRMEAAQRGHAAAAEILAEKTRAVGEMPEIPHEEFKAGAPEEQQTALKSEAERLRQVAESKKKVAEQHLEGTKGTDIKKDMMTAPRDLKKETEMRASEKGARLEERKAERDARRGERAVTNAQPQGTMPKEVAMAARQEALEAQRQAYGVERAARMEMERAQEYHRIINGGEPAMGPMEGADDVTNIAKGSAKTEYAADSMAKEIADRDAESRRNQALHYGGTLGDAVRETRQKIEKADRVGRTITRDEVEKLKPQSGEEVGLMHQTAAKLKNMAGALWAGITGEPGGSRDFEEALRAIVGRQRYVEQESAGLAKIMAASPPETREFMRLAFDDAGREKIKAADVQRVANGQAPAWTTAHEALYQNIQELMDRIWGAQVKSGLIDAGNFVHNYLAQLYTNPEKAEAYFKAKLQSQTPFAFERIFSNIYTAVEEGGLKLKTYDVAEIVPTTAVYAARAVRDAEVLAEAGKVPNMYLNKTQFEKLKPADQGKYTKLSNGHYAHEEIWKPGKAFLEPGDPMSETLKVNAAIKHSILALDFVHIVNTGRAVVTHPGTLTHPAMWYDSLGARKLFEHPWLVGYVQEGGGQLATAGGDFGRQLAGSYSNKLPVRLVQKMADASHHFVFDKVVPAQKAMVAFGEIKKAFEKREAGHPMFKGMSDRQIYQLVAKRVETEFGNFDFRLSGVNSRVTKVLTTAFLAPSWNGSILRMTANALREIGAPLRGEATDFYNAKRFAGMLGSAYVATQASNMVMKKLGNTDYDPEKDWFRLVLPIKDPVTERNMRAKTFGPQFEYFQTLYNIADYTVRSKGPEVGRVTRALAYELGDFAGRKLHPALRAVGAVAGKGSAGVHLEDFMPMSGGVFFNFAKEYFSGNHHVTPDTAVKALAATTGNRQAWEFPPQVRSDFMITKDSIIKHNARAKVLLQGGRPDLAMEQKQSALNAKTAFLNRYRTSTFYDSIEKYANQVMH
jgi:hypothetical protein